MGKKGKTPDRICSMEEVTVIKEVTLQEYVSILPRENVTKWINRIKRECVLMIFDEHLDFWRKHNRYLLARKCYRGTAGNINGETIKKYI